MMNYAAAYGALRGLLFGVQMACKYSTGTIDGKELAVKIQAAIDDAEIYGHKYDEEHRDAQSNHR